MNIYGVAQDRGTPSYHTFLCGILHEINHPAIGVPQFMETPILNCAHMTYQEICVDDLETNNHTEHI